MAVTQLSCVAQILYLSQLYLLQSQVPDVLNER